jgi:hypothetical protein
VNPNVVVEVVKLPKVLVAIAVITLQNFQSPFRDRVLVFENSEALLNFFTRYILA